MSAMSKLLLRKEIQKVIIMFAHPGSPFQSLLFNITSLAVDRRRKKLKMIRQKYAFYVASRTYKSKECLETPFRRLSKISLWLCMYYAI